jgi:hypothetical protein
LEVFKENAMFPYSPFLPPVLNHVLMNLMREVGLPKPGKSDDESRAFDVYRSLSLTLLHEHFELQTHERALKLIKDAWDSHAPFGLYLRNFSLGSVNSEPFTPAKDDDPGTYNMLTSTSMADLNLQIGITKHVANLLPIVSVENPAYDPRHKNGLPKLCLSDESWCEVAESLIAAAEIIIIYYEQPASGVNIELDMIRSLGRQQATVVVRPSGRSIVGLEQGNRIRQEVFPPHDQQAANTDQSNALGAAENLADFATAVSWDETGPAVRRLKKAIAKIPRPQSRVDFSRECPAPLAPQPPERVKQWANASTMAHQLLARREFENGNLNGAEDQITACLALTFFGDNAVIRAGMFLWLAHIQWLQAKLDYATDNVERALDLLERLPPIDYSPLSEISASLRQYRKLHRVRTILRRISALQDT